MKKKILTKQTPPAWKVETSHGAAREDLINVGMYQQHFQSAWLQRHAFQFMFGGILRGVFGLLSPHRYWDRFLEKELTELLKATYELSKARQSYGLYELKTRSYGTRFIRFHGVLWKNGACPNPLRLNPRVPLSRVRIPLEAFKILRSRCLHVRIDRLIKKSADLEFYCEDSHEVKVVSMRLEEFDEKLRLGHFLMLPETPGSLRPFRQGIRNR